MSSLNTPSVAAAKFSNRSGRSAAALASTRRASSSPSISAPNEQHPCPRCSAGLGRMPWQPLPQMHVQFDNMKVRSNRHTVSPSTISSTPSCCICNECRTTQTGTPTRRRRVSVSGQNPDDPSLDDPMPNDPCLSGPSPTSNPTSRGGPHDVSTADVDHERLVRRMQLPMASRIRPVGPQALRASSAQEQHG